MLRLSAILLSGLMLLQSLHLGMADLAQLDELLEHARYHQEQYGDSFLTFLSKHYGEQKEQHQQDHREEQPEHEELPFQQVPNQVSGHLHWYLAQRFHWDGILENEESQSHLYYYLHGSPNLFTDGVFQPPRQA